jgi:hypothetical protein
MAVLHSPYFEAVVKHMGFKLVGVRDTVNAWGKGYLMVPSVGILGL